MARSILPPFVDYFVPTVYVLKARGGSVTIEEMEEDVAAAMGLSDEARTEPHGDTGRTQFQYELAWVRTYLKKVGAATNSERGVWTLTERGEALSDGAIRAIVQEVRDQRKKRDPAGNTSAMEIASPPGGRGRRGGGRRLARPSPRGGRGYGAGRLRTAVPTNPS